MPPADARHPRSRGFTLLEVLVAFAIASIALAVLYRGAIDGLLGSREAARTEEAVSRARSRLAALCVLPRLTPGEQSGNDGSSYAWRTRIAAAGSKTLAPADSGEPTPPVRADLFAVRVIVSWPGLVRPHQVELETRCLTIAPPPQRP